MARLFLSKYCYSNHMEMRINKFLTLCGVGSRRKNEYGLKNGEFLINGVVVKPGEFVDTKKYSISYRERKLAMNNVLEYYILNKPLGVISTAKGSW